LKSSLRTCRGDSLIAKQNTDSGGYTNDYYYTADIVGSNILITNSAGGSAAAYTYDSYGNTTATTGGTFAATTNPWRYGAGYTDPNGTIKLGARYYNTGLGRFTQPDPSGQEANNYAYAAANPITNNDPSGLFVDVPSDYAYDTDLGAQHDYCTISPDEYDGVSGTADFRGPCAYHDECYGSGGDRFNCDINLNSDLHENCHDSFSWYEPDRYVCYDVANLYLDVVVIAN